MRRVSLYTIFFLISNYILFSSPHPVYGETSFPVIQEVQIAGEVSDDEFIELYNPTESPVDISGWQLRRKTESGSVSSIKVFGKDTIIQPHSYYLWANSKGVFATIADTSTSSSALANNNSIALYNKSGSDAILIDSLTWGNGALFLSTDSSQITPLKNESLSRETSGAWVITQPSDPQNSHTSPSPNAPIVTPPESGSPLPPPSPEPVPIPETPLSGLSPAAIPLNTTISINELLPNPLPSEEEFIELYNQSNEPVDISNWTLHDASKKGKYTFPKESIILPNDFLVIPKSLFRFALNNSNETLVLRDSEDRIVQTLTYPKSIAGVSLNQHEPSFRGGIPTPGKENILNDLPITKERVPKSGFPDIALSFDARGKDSEGSALKYVWDFGDGHKSYKEKTTHKYQKTGTYIVNLTTKDSQDSVQETFTLTIKKYTPPKLRLVALSPNPEGADTGKEWVAIQNKSKKEVNLKGFSFATGTKGKKLINHPIRESISLEPGDTLRLTREHALFSLPNTEGYLELRAPNGDVVDKFHYHEEQSLAENTLYKKEKGGRWALLEEPSVLGVASTSEDVSSIDTETILEAEATPPEEPSRTEEEKITLRSRLTLLFASEDFANYQIVSNQSFTDKNFHPTMTKKKDSFESLREKLNTSLISLLWL